MAASAVAGGGGALLSASLQVLFDRMASREILDFLRGQKLGDTLLWKLKMKLLAVKGVLNDAEAKQITDSYVKYWVDELKDAVYDAEDLLADIAAEALRCKMEMESSDSQFQVSSIIISSEGIKSRVEVSLLRIHRCPNLVYICFKTMEAACFLSLELYDCPELIFPVQGLPSSLTSLEIVRCNKFTSQVEFGLQCLSSLTSLKISGLLNLISLDGMGLQLLTALRKLQIHDCPKLQFLTEERLPTSFSSLIIHNCSLLKDWCKFWTREDWPRIAHIQAIVIDDQVL